MRKLEEQSEQHLLLDSLKNTQMVCPLGQNEPEYTSCKSVQPENGIIKRKGQTKKKMG